MTACTELLIDGFGRVREIVHNVLGGLSDRDLTWRVDAESNTIGWLVWHLIRIQDDHIADVAGRTQVWFDGWYERSGLPFAPTEHGYGHTAASVAVVHLTTDFLGGYLDAVHAQTVDYLATLSDEDFARVVDDSWDPPVTLGVRLVSVLSDDLQHAGQSALIKGLISRR